MRKVITAKKCIACGGITPDSMGLSCCSICGMSFMGRDLGGYYIPNTDYIVIEAKIITDDKTSK